MSRSDISEQDALTLFRAGRFAELVERSLSQLPNRPIGSQHRFLVAHALLHAGDVPAALRIAGELNASDLHPLLRSQRELILGIADKHLGDLAAARDRMQTSIRLAKEAGSTSHEAWARVTLLRLLAEGEPQELVRAAFGETRRVVMRAGDPHVTTYLHDSVALLEAQNGHLDEARRHLGTAASILQRFPNAWLEQVIHTSRLCIACLEGDIAEATTHAREARRLIKVTGGCASEFTLDVNEAHINIFGGRFAQANVALQRVLAKGRTLARLSALEDLARMQIALNRLDDCEETIALLLQARNDSSVANCYPVRWVATTRTKLLMRQGLSREAARWAGDEAHRARMMGDGALSATLTFLGSEAFARAGNSALAARGLFRASQDGAVSVREYLGQYFDSIAEIVSTSEPALARVFRSRANRIWRQQGNLWAQVEARFRNGPALPVEDVRPNQEAELDTGASAASQKLAPLIVLDSICAAFDLAALGPRLVSSELRTVAELLGCSADFNEIDGSRVPTTLRGRAVFGAKLEGARQAVLLQCGVTDDPLKNLVLSDLLRLARTVSELAQAQERERLRAAVWPAEDESSGDALFLSDEMTALAATARKVAPTPVPVLITGETGTGKEILARAIHAASTRAAAVFLPFNCSAGTRDMIDAQLFGHRRGAFTGATEHAPGVLRAAAGGTLFLDEIGEAPLHVQPKLLRFLESGEIHPIGEPHPLKVDVRVIAATNLDLDAAVASGRFRDDLFYRLNIVRLHLPPLRERRVEIPVFAQHFLRRHARDLAKGDLRLAEETMEYLLLYKWPGNVRQLANEMRRLAALAERDAVLMPEHLSPEIVASRRTVPASERTLEAHEVVVRLDQPLAAATEHLERVIIPYALRLSGGRVEEAARTLGLSRKGLYLKRLRLGLEPPAPQARSA